MARQPSPQKAHRLKDFCTLEQASYIAQEATRPWLTSLEQRVRALETPWYKKLWRRLTREAA